MKGFERKRSYFFVIIAIAFFLRLYFAINSNLTLDEYGWIELAEQCRYENGKLMLVDHGYQHSPLAVYFIKISSLLFGADKYGYRFLNIIAGLLTIGVLYKISRKWFSWEAGIVTALLVTFNEYHISISSFATAKSYYFLFCSLGIYYFWEGIKEDRSKSVILSGLFLGIAFLCNEIAGLLPISFCIFLLATRARTWFLKKDLYLAVFLFFVVISPDIYWNVMNVTPDKYGYVNYLDHLKRISRFGFSIEPFAFYFSGLFNGYLTDIGVWVNESKEYPSQNSLWGLLCFSGVLFSVLKKKDIFEKLLSTIFVLIFGLLLFLTWKPDPVFDKGFIKVEWVWCAITLIPAILLTSQNIVHLKKISKVKFGFLCFILFLAITESLFFVLTWR